MNSKIPVFATGRAFSFPRALAFSLALALGLSSLSSPAVFADTVSAGPGVSGPAAGGAASGGPGAGGAAASGAAGGTSGTSSASQEDPNKLSASEKLTRSSSGTYKLFKKGETISGVMRRGVDVAHYQGDIDWKTAKANDIDFVMLGTRYRGEVDPLFWQNVRGAEAAGVDIGVYIYSYATSVEMAEQEADFVLKLIKDVPISYPVAFDAENAETLGLQPKDKITDIVNAFCKKISDAGYFPILYANENWVKTKLDMNALSKYPLWVAAYERKYTQTQAVMWQGTESGIVPGIEGGVDIDLQFKDLSSYCPSDLWRKIGGEYYYYKNYRMQKNTLINDGKNSYYMDSDGKISHGWITVDGKKRYFDEKSGVMRTGWKQLDGKWYYFNSDGTPASGWINDNGSWYYINRDGVMLAGVQNINEVLYDLGTDGVMKHDLVVKYNGKDYTIGSDGAMREGIQEAPESTAGTQAAAETQAQAPAETQAAAQTAAEAQAAAQTAAEAQAGAVTQAPAETQSASGTQSGSQSGSQSASQSASQSGDGIFYVEALPSSGGSDPGERSSSDGGPGEAGGNISGGPAAESASSPTVAMVQPN